LLIHARASDEPLLFALGEAAGPAAGAAEQAVFLMVFRQIPLCRNSDICELRGGLIH